MYLYIILYLFSVTISNSAAMNPQDEDLRIRLLSIELCEVESELDPFTATLEIESSQQDKRYLVGKRVELNINRQLDRDYNMTCHIEKWVNGNWNTQSIVALNLWDSVQIYLKRIWEKIGLKVQPQIPDEPPFEMGTYVVEDIEVLKEDIDIPGVITGRLRATTRFFAPAGEVLCVLCEVEVER